MKYSVGDIFKNKRDGKDSYTVTVVDEVNERLSVDWNEGVRFKNCGFFAFVYWEREDYEHIPVYKEMKYDPLQMIDDEEDL